MCHQKVTSVVGLGLEKFIVVGQSMEHKNLMMITGKMAVSGD